MSFSPAIALYRGVVAALGPFAGAWLKRRARDGKEDPARLSERYGLSSQPRPRGRVAWLHAASVGESGVALQLLDALAAQAPDLHFVLTSGTRTSAEFITQRAPPRTTHIYAPIDRLDAVRRFLAHWRPDLGVFVESEMWPNLILEASAQRIPLALVNARMSPDTLARWTRWPKAARKLLGAFSAIYAADSLTAETLSLLRGKPVSEAGNLKLAASPAADPEKLAALKAEIGARPLWLAASTHAGEDEILLAAHERLRATHTDALLIIAPRHPERGEAVAALAHDAPRRAQGASIGAASVYVADTIGELATFYAAAPVAFIAGSLLPELKGHNAAEAAKLGAAILTGPHVESFQDLFDALLDAGGAQTVRTPNQIADAVSHLWRDKQARARSLEAARAVTDRNANALTEIVTRLTALLPRETKPAHAPA